MSEPNKEQQDRERAAREAERLRTDEPFALAVKAARSEAVAALAEAEQRLVDAVLNDRAPGESVNDVRRLQAKVEAIDALATEIAHLIIRGTPRVLKPVA